MKILKFKIKIKSIVHLNFVDFFFFFWQGDADKQIAQLMKKVMAQLSDCAVIKHGTRSEHEHQLLVRPASKDANSAT
jgi:hypothetical protein